MTQYKFEDFNIIIVDPVITIKPKVREVDPESMTISVDVVLTTPNGTNFVKALDNVAVANLNYDSTTLEERVMTKLEEFIV